MNLRIKELRIGNHVLAEYYDSETEEEAFVECTVVSLDSVDMLDYNIYVESVDSSVEVFNGFHGIPITEPKLVELGFKKWNTPKGITYSKGYMILHLRKRGWVIKKKVIEPKYIHQIQNMYHALYGKELIKSK